MGAAVFPNNQFFVEIGATPACLAKIAHFQFIGTKSLLARLAEGLRFYRFEFADIHRGDGFPAGF